MPEEVQKVDKTGKTEQTQTGAAAPAPPQGPSGPFTAASARAEGAQPASAATSATGGRELDPGKSTTRGEVDYVDGMTDITDADTLIDISQILANKTGGKSGNMKVEDMAEALRAQGYDVEVTKVNGKQAIRFANGDVFVDTSGDGQLGTEDVKFSNALSKVEQRFGIDLSGLKSTMDMLDLRNRLSKKSKELGGMGGLDALLDAGSGQLSEIKRKLAQTDLKMAGGGYQGNDDAFSLWKDDKLERALTKMEIPMPDIPKASELYFTDTLDRLTGLTDIAHELATELAQNR